jgi:hypothetical protein
MPKNKEFSLKTKNGSLIKRSHHGVGKMMGKTIYVHHSYVSDIMDRNVYMDAVEQLPEEFMWTIVKYDTSNGNISFISSPDFDETDEPIVGDSYLVKPNGIIKLTKQKDNFQIYHHKWLFVKDDYKEFDVDTSKKRSEYWLSISDQINMAKIGYSDYWYGTVLPLLSNVWDTKEQEFTSAKTCIRIIPKPSKLLVLSGDLSSGSINLDIGGGKFEDNTNFLLSHGVTNYVYDPFNRTKEHNLEVISKTSNGRSNTVTIFNVMNTIKEETIQLQVLEQSKNALKQGGKVYVYSNYKDKTKSAGQSGKDKYQHHKLLGEYLDLVKKVYDNAYVDRKLQCIVGEKMG